MDVEGQLRVSLLEDRGDSDNLPSSSYSVLACSKSMSMVFRPQTRLRNSYQVKIGKMAGGKTEATPGIEVKEEHGTWANVSEHHRYV